MEKPALKKLRQNLPQGTKAILAAEFGLTVQSISQILLGNRKNENVILRAVDLVSEHSQRKAKATEFIDSL